MYIIKQSSKTRPQAKQDLKQNKTSSKTRPQAKQDLKQNKTSSKTRPRAKQDLEQNKTSSKTRPRAKQDLKHKIIFNIESKGNISRNIDFQTVNNQHVRVTIVYSP